MMKKWYLEEIYELMLVSKDRWIGRMLWKGGDGWIIEGLGKNGV